MDSPSHLYNILSIHAQPAKARPEWVIPPSTTDHARSNFNPQNRVINNLANKMKLTTMAAEDPGGLTKPNSETWTPDPGPPDVLDAAVWLSYAPALAFQQ